MKLELELTQDQYMVLEYDMLLEKAWRHDLSDYQPHFENKEQTVDEDGYRVDGCYVTKPHAIE
jgi:hypothetical protein